MDEIRRLLRVTARRASADQYTSLRFRLLRSTSDRVRELCEQDGMTVNALLEAFLDGYVHRHPAVLALIDQRMRDVDVPEKRGPKMSKRDLDEIYAAAGSGMVEEE